MPLLSITFNSTQGIQIKPATGDNVCCQQLNRWLPYSGVGLENYSKTKNNIAYKLGFLRCRRGEPLGEMFSGGF